MTSVYFCAFTITVYVARVQELVPVLQAIKPGMVSVLLTLILSLHSGRFQDRRILVNKESKLMVGFLIVSLLSVPLSVWETLLS